MSPSVALTRRRLLRVAAAAAVAWKASPWRIGPTSALAQTTPPGVPDPIVVVPTLEAFADTLIPGEKRSPADRPIAGAAGGPGAVQAGAIDLMFLPAAGIAPALPGHVALLNARAAAFAAARGILLDPTVPPLVALGFAERSELLVEVLDGASPDFLVWYALAGLAFLAYHTAGHLPTVDAVRGGHPGLAAIGFPAPDSDGLWRFAEASYRRPLARRARSRRGSPL
ncbi:MAG TPA: DUF5987 family protein [Candidatus Binatia bacterium]|nr:DUF5987 family protein [Candidatus Binatia bacterium]